MNKPVRIDDSWRRRLAGEFAKPYFAELRGFVRGEYAAQKVFPPAARIFRAFDECPFDHVKVVMLGQDPYHGAGQANGLCFAVKSGVAPPPSLQNIFKEIEADLGHPVSRDPDLSRWARQGVLLLNATLTVREGAAGSHQNKGWEQFTDAAVRALSEGARGWCFCCGAITRAARAPISTGENILCWSWRTPRRCRRVASSAAGISPGRTPILARAARRRSIGERPPVDIRAGAIRLASAHSRWR